MYQTLLVDDRDVFILELKRLKVWDEHTGFHIAGKAPNGAEALAMLRVNRYDLVITDIRMPKVDGIQLLQEIKRESLCPCVVLISEYSEFEYARRGLVLGAFDYLVKPADATRVKALLGRVAAHLESQSEDNPGGVNNEKQTLPAFYPAAEEKNIIALIGTQDARIPALFESAAQGVLQMAGKDMQTAEHINRRMYLNVTAAIYRQYDWLRLYVAPHQLPEDVPPEQLYLDMRTALSELSDILLRLLPSGAQGLLHKICRYLAGNPESPANLASISEKFYINSTYLSNTFRHKTEIRFNDYITTVRMLRARYLLIHSEMKAYEIGGVLGYSDADYFNRLFKKYFASTPSEYRRACGVI